MYYVVFAILAGVTMASCDIADIYGFKNNLTKIHWAHAVNNYTFLQNKLNESGIHMIEADVSFGTIVGSGNAANIPIMAHPPANTSDLSLENFIQNVTDYNSKNSKTIKGIKLDFKSSDAWTPSMKIIKDNYNSSYPLWINADIVEGPNGAKPTVITDSFIKGIQGFPNSTISVGWTTNVTGVMNNYTDDQISKMTKLVEGLNQSITFPVRAAFAVNSTKQMKNLTAQVKGSTLTIWHGNGDQVNTEKLSKLILDVGVQNVYVDVPDEIFKQLRLNSGGNKTGLGIVSLVVSLFVALLGTKIF